MTQAPSKGRSDPFDSFTTAEGQGEEKGLQVAVLQALASDLATFVHAPIVRRDDSHAGGPGWSPCAPTIFRLA